MRCSAAFRAITPSLRRGQIPSHARLSHPHLRRASPFRRRQDRPPLGLGASAARSRRAPVHRSPRSLRHHPGGRRSEIAGLRARRDAEAGMGGAHRRRGGGAADRDAQSQPADRRGRGQGERDRGAVGGQGAAAPRVRRARLPRGDAAQISLPRSSAREPARQHHEAAGHHLVASEAHAGRGLLRVPDTDPDRFEPRGRARLSRALAACIRASSTRCRRRRSNSSS